MTCREFKHSAASFTIRELSRTQDEQLLRHVEQCGSCDAWLRRQRTLAASLQTLQASTAGCEAGPSVERALLRAFRQATPAVSMSAAEVEERSRPLRSGVTPSSAPFALRLSRYFEVGAYLAVAAALLVGIFLGVRLLQPRSSTVPVQSQAKPQSTQPPLQQPAVAARDLPGTGSRTIEPTPQNLTATRSSPKPLTSKTAAAPTTEVANSDAQADADAGYVALMFCDPLSCSADTQVVRMELPAANDAAQGVQPQLADVIVGYDGLVRAVRIVN